MSRHEMVYERSGGKGRRGKVKKTVKQPKWKRELHAGVSGFKRQAKTMLAAAGLLWMLVMVAQAIGGR